MSTAYAPHSHTLDVPCDQLPSDTQDDHEDTDIYRGDPPHLPRSPSPESTASAPSSGSFLTRGRLGAIALVVELAITRWARSSSSSSSPSSSSSSRSSINTVSRSHIVRRRRRRQSTSNLQCVQSERDIAARIKARAESRHITREFTLYIPPTTGGPHQQAQSDPQAHSQRVSRTTSMPLILGQLTTALKMSTRAIRHQGRLPAENSAEGFQGAPIIHHSYMLPGDMKVPSRAASFTELSGPSRGRKGKGRQNTSVSWATVTSTGLTSATNTDSQKPPKAWWLDVASPTWEDMRAIGKLLHLHPLTLEDILHQDPREKLELFSRLGYYFIVFRAIESRTTRERFRLHEGGKVNETQNHGDDGGIVGEANIYLVVFREGICSFHFKDISEHTERVRNRVLLLEESINMSSDWIAHGLIDSIVDAFFPFLEEVEKEVVDIEDLVYSEGHDVSVGSRAGTSDVTLSADPLEADENVREVEKSGSAVDEKQGTPAATTFRNKPRFSLWSFFRPLSRVLHTSLAAAPRVAIDAKYSTGMPSTLRRMARTRRLVTSLTRLLATKSEVVMQIQKRLMTSGQSGLGNGNEKADDAEVAIYIGDVQDHIMTLQHSLAHYERMLSQSHPTYLSQLSTIAAMTKSGTDKGVVLLTTVSIAVLCIQTLLGLFSLNIHLPSNGHGPDDPGHPYNVFFIVLAMAILILCIYLSVVRRWWVLAKRRRGAVL